ncbi:hypothetical protein CLU79DRAFT_835492 [Phycomyces nitens]|nr:hypothetical protein CLU79DRAFT_835492 [Phycomyces nitens]
MKFCLSPKAFLSSPHIRQMLTKTSTLSRCKHFLRSLSTQKQTDLASLCETTTLNSSPDNSQDILLTLHKSSIHVDPQEFLGQKDSNRSLPFDCQLEKDGLDNDPVPIQSEDLFDVLQEVSAPCSANGYSNFYLKLPNGNWQMAV